MYVLLSESHLSGHTFPETGFAAINLYCCRPREAWHGEDGVLGVSVPVSKWL